MSVVQYLGLSEVGEGQDIACVVKLPSTVRHPQLYTCDLYGRADIGEGT